MFKYLLALTLAFSFMSFANADSIPDVADPKNASTVWTMTVYNGSGDDITSGVAVRWDIGAATTDMEMWVEQNDAIADIRTAGVVPYGRPLAAGAIGDIIVRGPAIMYDGGNTTSDSTGVEADATGYPVDETLAASDEALLGWCIEDDASTVANTNLDSNYAVIFVQPTPYSGD